MTFPVLTAFYGGLLGLLLVALSVWVSLGRARFGAHHGDGGQVALQRRIRAQANFTEYVPMALVLIGLAESAGSAGWIIRALLLVLVAARIAHPIGMLAEEGSAAQFALRAPAIIATWGVLLAASVMLLAR